MHLHQVSKREALRIAALHLKGEAYTWWFYESSSSNHGNIDTYARFTKIFVKRFDVKQSESSLIKLAKHKHSKPLHELEIFVTPTPLQISIEGVKNLCDTLPKEISPLYEDPSSQKEDMEIPPSREDQDLRSLIDDEAFSNIDKEGEKRRANNAVLDRKSVV